MVRTKWYGQNGIRTKCHWTKWYEQNDTDKNGTNKMVASFVIDYNSSEIITYLVTKSHK